MLIETHNQFAKCETQNVKLKANLSFLSIPLQTLHIGQLYLMRSGAHLRWLIRCSRSLGKTQSFWRLAKRV